MSEIESQIKVRLDKLEKLRSLGVDPYPHRFDKTHSLKEVADKREELVDDQSELKAAGRIMALRRQGKTTFANIKEGKHRLQLYVSQKRWERSFTKFLNAWIWETLSEWKERFLKPEQASSL